MPIVPGHTLVCPVRCIATRRGLTIDERVEIDHISEKITIALVESFGAKGFNFAWNEGSLAGQSVPHYHLHILPRKEGDSGIYQYEPRNFLYRPGSREESPLAELSEVAGEIRKALGR